MDSLLAKKELQIILAANVAAVLPVDPLALPSNSAISAVNDTTLNNNQVQTTVYAIKPFVPPPPASKNFDLALQYQAVTDTSVTINGQKKQAVLAGKSYSYRITVQNNGPQTAKNISLWATAPDSVRITSTTLFTQKKDTLFWTVDSLLAKKELQIILAANVAAVLPVDPLALPSNSAISAVNDTTLNNNQVQTTVYAIKPFVPPPPASKNFDLALQYQAVTDTSVTINGQKKQAVLAGKSYSYRITVQNNGPQTAKNISLWATAPDSVRITSTTLFTQKKDTLFWTVDSLLAKKELQIILAANVAAVLPVDPLALPSNSAISAVNDTTLNNNQVQTTVYAIKPFVPPPPASKNFDLALQYQAVTDTSVTINGQKKQAVLAGKSYSYRITVQNNGPQTAKNISLWATAPDSVRITSTTLFTQKKDTLFWTVDSLLAKKELQIILAANVAAVLPVDPLALPSNSAISAVNDTTLNNNQVQTTVYAIKPFVPPPPASKNFDLALQYQAVTDTSVTINGQQKQAVLAGKSYSYRITVQNNGPQTAKNISLWATAPDSVRITSTTLFTQKKDTLFWTVDSLLAKKELQIILAANVAAVLPVDPLALPSNSAISAVNDTTLNNNQVQTTVYAIKPFVPPPPASKNFDLALQYQAVTDTSVTINGQKKQAVLAGKSYSYRITVQNNGPQTAKNISLWATAPDSVRITSTTLFTQKKDTLFWTVDSLLAKKELQIILAANVAAVLPVDPLALPSNSAISAVNDTTLNNNQVQTTVYAIKPFVPPPPASKNFDLALQYQAVTDTSVTINGQKKQAVLAGKSYSYRITVQNNGPQTAKNISLWATAPDSVRITSTTLFTQKKDTLFWTVDSLLAKKELQIILAANVAAVLPVDPLALPSNSAISAVNDTTLNNNQVQTTVYAIKPFVPPPPASKNFDLALQYQAVTDTSVTINGQKKQAVLAGKSYSYRITVQNNGPQTAKNISLWATAPDSVRITSTTLFTQKKDTLFWTVDSLLAKKELQIILAANVAAVLPVDPLALPSNSANQRGQ